jgi:type II secretory pathway component PulJ
MARLTSGRVRRGYTLMEVVVALAVAMMLLGGLYYAFTIVIGQTEAARDLISETEEARGVFNKLKEDITGHLGPIDSRVVRLPKEFFQKAPKEEEAPQDAAATDKTNTSGQQATTGQQSTSGQQATGDQSTTQQSSTGSNTSQTAKEAEPAEVGYSYFNLGVLGQADRLILFAGKIPDYKLALKTGILNKAYLTDLRRVCYWIVQGPEGPLGLARHEAKVATSTEALSYLPFDGPAQEEFLIAPRAVSVIFEYFSAGAWNTTWDGSQLESDQKTLKGPPMAIAIYLEMKKGLPLEDGSYETRMHRHVVALPASNGTPNQVPEPEVEE